MTWSLNTAGHTPAAGSWKDVEQKLFDELQAVLSKPEYGASGSSFHGNFVHGEPHVKAEDSAHTHESGQDAAENDGAP